MKRGLASPLVHSALAITRRSLLQLARVRRAKSLKRRSGLPVLWLSSAAVASSAPNPPTNRRLRARPNRKSTPLFSHQVISPSRAKPASARSRIRTAGQRPRMWATIRLTFSTLPEAGQPSWQGGKGSNDRPSLSAACSTGCAPPYTPNPGEPEPPLSYPASCLNNPDGQF